MKVILISLFIVKMYFLHDNWCCRHADGNFTHRPIYIFPLIPSAALSHISFFGVNQRPRPTVPPVTALKWNIIHFLYVSGGKMSQPSCPHCCLKLFQPFLLPALCFYYTQPLITVRLSSLTARGAIVCSAPSLWITRLSRSSDAPHAKLHLPVPFNKTGQGVWRERERQSQGHRVSSCLPARWQNVFDIVRLVCD